MNQLAPLPRKSIVKWGPRTKATAAIAEACYREFILTDHPADCVVCCGAKDADTIILRHRQYQAALSDRIREREARGEAARAAFYAGACRMVIKGVPCRYPVWVAKLRNRRMLGLGT